jgi:uncharacterized protein (DUF2336 family)
MIVERFLEWIRTAPVARRAEGCHALARSYLFSALSADERDGLEAAMTVLLDDPAGEVRFALAHALADSDKAPHHIVLALSEDQPHVAALVAERSPLLLDSELIDLLATREEVVQIAIARRPVVSRAVAAAVSEVATAEACLELLCNSGARVPRFSLDRMIERHGDDPELRETLLLRNDLPLDARQALVGHLTTRLKTMLSDRNWLSVERAETVTREARDKATVAMTVEAPAAQIPMLVKRLIADEELTPALLVRAVAGGQTLFFIHALAQLSGVPVGRVEALVVSGRAANLKALLEKASLPAGTFPAFAAAIDVIRQFDGSEDSGSDYRRATYLIDAILNRFQANSDHNIEQILGLLRRFATEAKRDAARSYIKQVMAAA